MQCVPIRVEQSQTFCKALKSALKKCHQELLVLGTGGVLGPPALRLLSAATPWAEGLQDSDVCVKTFLETLFCTSNIGTDHRATTHHRRPRNLATWDVYPIPSNTLCCHCVWGLQDVSRSIFSSLLEPGAMSALCKWERGHCWLGRALLHRVGGKRRADIYNQMWDAIYSHAPAWHKAESDPCSSR